jgi:hypothetical protein
MMMLFVAVFFAFCATDHVLVAYRRSLDFQFPLARNLAFFCTKETFLPGGQALLLLCTFQAVPGNSHAWWACGFAGHSIQFGA